MAERIMSNMFASIPDEQLIMDAFGSAVLKGCSSIGVDFEEFKKHCSVLDGKLGDYYLSGLRDLAPDLFGAIRYDYSVRSFAALCRILNLIIKGGLI